MNLGSILTLVWPVIGLATIVEAGFFTFYMPNSLKPKGFNELSDMIDRLDVQINEIKDQFSDARFFWGQMQEVSKQVVGPSQEESVCAEVFPLFIDLAINYANLDYEHYIKPLEEYKKYLEESREEWYPTGAESKAALPREWEQNLLAFELSSRLKWLDLFTNTESFKMMRQKMVDIWKKVRRSLDYSLPCVYLRYAYRQIAEDISEVALNANLEGMKEAQKVLEAAYKRIGKFANSDKLIIEDIENEIEKFERFTIKD